MTRFRTSLLATLMLMGLLGGCASRPVNPPLAVTDADTGYRFQTRQAHFKDKDDIVILAFSGGGTRAAAFSYGVLEFLRRTEVVGPKGDKGSLLDHVDIITGVSGGSFTALAYGLYGDKLFSDYEQRFLKRDVQGEIIARTLNPANWASLWSTHLGPFRIGGPVVRRNPLRRRHLRRPRPRQRPDDPGVGHRHLDRCPLRLQPEHLRHPLLRSQRPAAIARRRGLVGGAGRAFARHHQQLRWQLQHGYPRLGEAFYRVRRARHDRRRARSGGSRRRKPTPTAPAGRTSIWWTAACRTTWACVAYSMHWN